jgi:hypothetical protein
LAQRSEHVDVSAVDWPLFLEIMRQMTARFGLNSRFEFLPGDLLEIEFPMGYDVATLGYILHITLGPSWWRQPWRWPVTDLIGHLNRHLWGWKRSRRAVKNLMFFSRK